MTCEHGRYKPFLLSGVNELPRIVLRQCFACHHWWIAYGQEFELYHATGRAEDLLPPPVSGYFRVAAVPRRAWNA